MDEVHGREGAELAADRQTHLAAPEHLAHLTGGQWHAGKCSGIRRECMACVQAVLGRVWAAPHVPRMGCAARGHSRTLPLPWGARRITNPNPSPNPIPNPNPNPNLAAALGREVDH